MRDSFVTEPIVKHPTNGGIVMWTSADTVIHLSCDSHEARVSGGRKGVCQFHCGKGKNEIELLGQGRDIRGIYKNIELVWKGRKGLDS